MKLKIKFLFFLIVVCGVFPVFFLLSRKVNSAPSISVPLTLNPSTTIFYKDQEFTVDIIASPSGITVGGTTIILDHSEFINLTSVTPGNFFQYPANTEMLAFGITCSQQSDCRTSASEVSCSPSTHYCKNQHYPDNTSAQLRFDLGAACEISGTNCFPAANIGPVAQIKIKPNKIGNYNLSFNPETAVAVFDENNEPVASNAAQLGDPLNIRVIPQCSAIDFDTNQQVNVNDIQQISSRWNKSTGDDGYETKYDIDENGIIDIRDIQFVSSRWLETCL